MCAFKKHHLKLNTIKNGESLTTVGGNQTDGDRRGKHLCGSKLRLKAGLPGGAQLCGLFLSLGLPLMVHVITTYRQKIEASDLTVCRKCTSVCVCVVEIQL